MHAAVGRAVGVVLETRLAHGAAGPDEVGHGVPGSECGREGDLRVHRGARSADRWRLVTAAAAIEIHPGAEPGGDGIRFREVFESGDEERLLTGSETVEHPSRALRYVGQIRS